MGVESDLYDTMVAIQERAVARNINERPIMGLEDIDCEVGPIAGSLGKYMQARLAACVRIEECLEEAKFQVKEHVGNQLEATRNQLANWTGDAKDSFDDFLGQAITAQMNQPAYIDEVINVVRAYRELVRAAREDAQAIADACLEALQPDPVGAGELLQGMAKLAATIGGLLINPGETSRAAFGLFFIEAFNSLSSTWSEVTPTIEGTGHTSEILRATYHAANDLDAAVTERAVTIGRAATGLVDELDGDRIFTIMPMTMPAHADSDFYSVDDFEPTRRVENGG